MNDQKLIETATSVTSSDANSIRPGVYLGLGRVSGCSLRAKQQSPCKHSMIDSSVDATMLSVLCSVLCFV